jgi:hypothetical protein
VSLKLGSCQHLAPPLQEQEQDPERLILQTNPNALSFQFAEFEIERALIEFKATLDFWRRSFFDNRHHCGRSDREETWRRSQSVWYESTLCSVEVDGMRDEARTSGATRGALEAGNRAHPLDV